MENGVKTVCAKNQCVGCMACFDMCPKSAITIVDTRQAYNAVIDEEKCIHCGICTNVCQNNKETTLKHPETWYQGWIEDEKQFLGNLFRRAAWLSVAALKTEYLDLNVQRVLKSLKNLQDQNM